MIFSKTKSKNNQKKLVNVFSALGDPTRYQLLTLLYDRNEICVSELAQEVGISNAGVSQQLKVLEQAGLIERNRMGQKICYRVVDDTEVNRKLLKIINQ